jgi:hypothetical protein
MATVGTKINNIFCKYGRNDSLRKPYARTFPTNGDGTHSEKRRTISSQQDSPKVIEGCPLNR